MENSINVLIVDDDRMSVKCIVSMMDWEKLGIDRVFEAYGIRQAEEIIGKEPVDLLLCDIEMPKGNGYELLEWIEENHYHITTIFITSYARFDYATKAMKMQVVDYILKPVSRESLEKSLSDAIAAVKEKKKYYSWAAGEETTGVRISALPEQQPETENEDDPVAVIKQYLTQHLDESIDRSKLADLVHLHPDYLSRLFKETTGFSIIDYLTELRMQEANRLLSKTTERISEIAGKVGYPDTSYFTRMFKRRFGVPPREFRR